ncbi:ribonuclease H-like YkuK family protein [Portibacter lacus]|uniref:DUF458 domain-containing protein n=1 Tax=Portibacter lacus TaxID=1099794 RepID=A0AA37WD29_9BACT|nr:ribonuclease H-like YkuK family protein [Portibacter lacus]GLR16453.1 hypothetical protein GCM10007940_10680 [Portibacter lacus]
MIWKTLKGAILDNDIVKVVDDTLRREKELGYHTRICIGTDSQVTSGVTEFATVIVFVRRRQGGFMYIHKEKTAQPFGLKERMISEVSKSVQIAYLLQPTLEKHHVKLEVHADINSDPGFKSHAAFNEAMGYIKGMGFEFKAKPDAFASSYCADKVI